MEKKRDFSLYSKEKYGANNNKLSKVVQTTRGGLKGGLKNSESNKKLYISIC